MFEVQVTGIGPSPRIVHSEDGRTIHVRVCINGEVKEGYIDLIDSPEIAEYGILFKRFGEPKHWVEPSLLTWIVSRLPEADELKALLALLETTGANAARVRAAN